MQLIEFTQMFVFFPFISYMLIFILNIYIKLTIPTSYIYFIFILLHTAETFFIYIVSI